MWSCELDIYGKVRTLAGSKTFIPFRYQGQYEDEETGLYYNRFRYYSPDNGTYISQDPIGLVGGMPNAYAYVHDLNSWIDPFGLIKLFHGTTKGAANSIKNNGIDLSKNRPKTDFTTQGKEGFYTHDNLKDTQKYNKRFKGDTDIVKFNVPDEKLADLKIKIFSEPTDEWADFVTRARKGELVHDFDVVIGPKLRNLTEVMAGLENPKAIKNQIQIAITSDKAAKLLSDNIECD